MNNPRCPQLGGEPQSLVREGNVAIRCSIDERVEPGDAEVFLSPQEFTFKLIINNRWDENALAGQKTTGEPFRYCDYFSSASWMGQQIEEAGIEDEDLTHK